MIEIKIVCNRCGQVITDEDQASGSQQISIPVFGDDKTSIIKVDLHKKCLGIALKNMFKDFTIEPETVDYPSCEDCDIDYEEND